MVYLNPGIGLISATKSSTQNLGHYRRSGLRWLVKNRVSNNVGSVKHFLGVRVRALRGARHFALVEGFAMPTPGPVLVILLQARNSVRPMHLFDPNCDHDYYFELPREEERDTQSITRCSASHHRDVRALPRAN